MARNGLMAEGFIGRRSAHSSGGTVDLTLVRAGEKVSLPMDPGFDFFDPLTDTDSTGIPPEAKANRKRLVAVMARHGFRNYRREGVALHLWPGTFRRPDV
jgi:D-alanyl-D-alanine dipeptidase